MGLFDIFKKVKSQYDVEPEKNVPVKVYGIPNPNNFKNKDTKLDETFNSVLKEIIGIDLFWIEIIRNYFNKLGKLEDEKNAIELLRKLAEDKLIFNEFTKYLLKESYDIEGAININGITAKSIYEQSSNMSAIDVYITLYKIKEENNRGI